MKALLITLTLLLTSTTALAGDQQSKEKFLGRLLEKHVDKNISVERSVSSLLKSYPAGEEIILDTAFTKYPEQYKQIIRGALHVNPNYSEDVIKLALEHEVAACEQIIKTAINAEPAYADDIVLVATKLHPEDKDIIFRMALNTKPVMASSIVNASAQKYPDDFISYITMAFEELPDRFISLLENAFNNFPEQSDEVVEIAVKSLDKEHVRAIIDNAVKSGLSEKQATDAAIKGGADLVALNM